MPDDFFKALLDGTWKSSRSYIEGLRIQLGAGPPPPDPTKKVFGERVWIPGNVHVLILHPLHRSELPYRLENENDLGIAVLLRRGLRWRNSQKAEEEAERVARYQSTVVLKCFIAEQVHLNRPVPVTQEDEQFSDIEAEEGFWSAGLVGVLIKKHATPTL